MPSKATAEAALHLRNSAYGIRKQAQSLEVGAFKPADHFCVKPKSQDIRENPLLHAAVPNLVTAFSKTDFDG